MNIFGLFQNKEWNSFKAFPPAVQQDLASLLGLDSLAKTSISGCLSRAGRDNAPDSSHGDAVRRAAGALSNALRQGGALAGELQVCLLSTGVGKVFDAIKWNLIPPERVIECLGFLAMCQFRRNDGLEGDIDLKQSGYSSDPDEAKTQFLVMAAGIAGVGDFRGVNRYSDEEFDAIWGRLRQELFEANPARVGREVSLPKDLKDLFLGLSAARQQLLLGLGESLANKKIEKTQEQQAAKEPFDPVKHKEQHSLLYVPFPKIISIMRRAESDVVATFRGLKVQEYELRRLVSAKIGLPPAMVERFIAADARVVAYAITVAAAGTKDEKFIGCGVWKKVTESMEKKSLLDFQFMGEVQTYGMFGDVKKMPPKEGHDFSLGLEQSTLARKAPGNFLRASRAHRAENIHLLFGGTVILRHVLNHPEFGQKLAAMTLGLLDAIDLILEELKKGELLDWDQQKDLPN